LIKPTTRTAPPLVVAPDTGVKGVIAPHPSVDEFHGDKNLLVLMNNPVDIVDVRRLCARRGAGGDLRFEHYAHLPQAADEIASGVKHEGKRLEHADIRRFAHEGTAA
jgi:hypothetical protein